jgi:GrpB-like predicted nucleotidyltransferase (UPF0157 family)
MPLICVVDYDPAWPRIFEELRASVWREVEGLAVGIEHVGSTSVPGLAAKPSIDMDVVVRSIADVPSVIGRLATLGYVPRGDLGIARREAFQRPAGAPAHHLYVCDRESPALANHLALRDYLRTHPAAATSYGALKRELAGKFPDDVGRYIEGKTAMIVGILREQGFAEETLRAIEMANRSNDPRPAR